MDWWSILQRILEAVAGALVLAIGAFGVWLVGQVKRWQAKTDLATMKQNAKDAVQAVEQLYPEFPGEQKKKLALQWACHLNEVAGIKTTDQSDDTHIESSVFTLPPVDPPVKAPTETPIVPLG